MHYYNIFIWEIRVGIKFYKSRIVPLGNLTQKDVSKNRTSELESTIWHFRNIISWDYRSYCFRYMNCTWRICHFFWGQRSISRTEIDRVFRKLLDTAATSYRLIVDICVRINSLIFNSPSIYQRKWECRTRPIESSLSLSK